MPTFKRRRIDRSGRSSFAITLPKGRVRYFNLSSGDLVDLVVEHEIVDKVSDQPDEDLRPDEEGDCSGRAGERISKREHIRRMRIRLAALRRHAAARDPSTGRSLLAVAAGRASAIRREGDRAWGLEMALKRWAPHHSDDDIGPSHQ